MSVQQLADALVYCCNAVSAKPTRAVGDSMLFREDNRLGLVTARDFGKTFDMLPGVTASYPRECVVDALREGRGEQLPDGGFVDTVTLRKTDGTFLKLSLRGYRTTSVEHIGGQRRVLWEKTVQSWCLENGLHDMSVVEAEGECTQGFVREVFSHVISWAGWMPHRE